MNLPDSLRRGIRTFVQAFTGVVVLQLGSVAFDVSQGGWVPDVNWLKRVGISASVAGAVAFFSWLQNALEDGGHVPAVLKATASSGANPVTHDPAT